MLVRFTSNNLLEEVAPDVADLAIRNGFAEAYPPKNGLTAPDSSKSVDDFLFCVLHKNERRLQSAYGIDTKAAMQEMDGVLGGYLVPDEFADRLLYSDTPHPILSRASVFKMHSATLEVPLVNATAAPASGYSARFGACNPIWLEESIAATETPPTFKQLELVAKDLVGFAYLSNTLHSDFHNVVLSLKALLAEAFHHVLTHEFLLGSGLAKPRGALVADCAISVTRQTASTITLVDVGKMLARLLPGWTAATAMWVCHPSALEKLIPLVSTSSTGNGQGFTLLGLPVLIHEGMAVLGTAKDLALCDFRHYVVGMRQPFTIRASAEVALTTGRTAWRLSTRVDGAPWLQSAITPQVGSDTLSPFVYLT